MVQDFNKKERRERRESEGERNGVSNDEGERKRGCISLFNVIPLGDITFCTNISTSCPYIMKTIRTERRRKKTEDVKEEIEEEGRE